MIHKRNCCFGYKPIGIAFFDILIVQVGEILWCDLLNEIFAAVFSLLISLSGLLCTQTSLSLS